MTPNKINEATQLMAQMDLDMQNYVLDMLRHIKFTQDVFTKKEQGKRNDGKVEYGKTFAEICESL